MALSGTGGGPCRLAALDLLIRYQHVAASGNEIDTDHIPGAQPRKPTARGTLGRGIENGRAVRSPRLTTIADGRQARDTTLQQRIWWLHIHDFR